MTGLKIRTEVVEPLRDKTGPRITTKSYNLALTDIQLAMVDITFNPVHQASYWAICNRAGGV